MRFAKLILPLLLIVLAAIQARSTNAQSYGIELHNSLMPASGGMAGTSAARPQDLQSAINGNPASLTQFHGTQFSFGGVWVEPTYNIDQTVDLIGIGVTQYKAKSGTPGSALGNIGVTQDFSALGMPITAGLGFMGNAGAGVDFRDVPQSNGTSAHYIALDIPMAVGARVTDRLSVGGAMIFGMSFLDGPFVDVGGMVPDYALRASLGITYDAGCDTTIGAYWQSRKQFTFDDAAIVGGNPAQDINFDHPENFVFGVANDGFCDGRLLLAMDVIFKRHSDADFLRALYDDQWACTVGAQYCLNSHIRLRMGYGYNENPMAGPQVTSIGGVPIPDGIPGLRYVQGQFASVSQHRITTGAGVRDLLPGLDLDIFGGVMFQNDVQLTTTRASLEGYWVGAGLTWRFGRGSCRRLPVADDWGCGCDDDCGCL